MALMQPDQVEITGNHYVSRRERARDFCRRPRPQHPARSARPNAAGRLKSIPWVEQATVRRALPESNRSRNHRAHADRISARRQRYGAGGCARSDSRAAAQGRFSFSGGHRHRLRTCRRTIARSACSSSPDFLQQIGVGAPGSDGSGERSGSFRRARFARDAYRTCRRQMLRARRPPSRRILEPGADRCADSGAFRRCRFRGKYQSLIENIGQWRATAGRVESVDLRFVQRSGGESGHAAPRSDAGAALRSRPQRNGEARWRSIETEHFGIEVDVNGGCRSVRANWAKERWN